MLKYLNYSSVADPGCLSQIPVPDFYPSRIPDPGSRIPDPGSKNSNKREVKKNHTFFVYFLNITFVRNVGQFSKNCWSFYPKNFLCALKYTGLRSRIWDPRSGIRKKPIPDPGPWGQKGTGSWIPDPQHWIIQFFDVDLWSGMEKIRIRDEHSGFATMQKNCLISLSLSSVFWILTT